MTSRDYVVLIGPQAALCERAHLSGLGVIVVDLPERLTNDVITCADHVIGTDYTNVHCTARLLSMFGEEVPICGVLSLTERGLLPAAKINDELGLTDNPVSVVERTQDKDLMRRWLTGDDDFAVPATVVHDHHELTGFLRSLDTPAVVKPHDGAGSVGVSMVREASEVPETSYPLLAEKYIAGREYSVEAVSQGGTHTIVGITEKVLFDGSFIERGHNFPAPLNAEEQETLRSFTERFLTRVGIENGLTHTEVVLTDNGPVAIETHTRNGGDHIANLVQLATGYDLPAVALDIKTGRGRPGQSRPTAARTSVIRYLASSAGTVHSIQGAQAARYLPGVVDLQVTVAKGDTVRAVASSYDRLGYVITTGTDLAEAVGHADAALAAVQVIIS